MPFKDPEKRRQYLNGSEGYQRRYRSRGRLLKLQLIREMGGECQLCGYNRNMAALEFDHRNPVEKIGNLSYFLKNNMEKAARSEAMKCRLLCANCHREQTWPVDNIGSKVV